jgi:RNA polymerase sigma factor (sigma-70 family)
MSEEVSMATSGRMGALRFPQTLWSVVLAAAGSSPRSQEALSTLCQTYWYPIYAFLRRQGHASHDAEDLTQGFLVRLCQKDRLRTVGREKGRFRSFLLVSLKNFLADEATKARAQKRGGGQPLVSLDTASAEERYALEPPDVMDPEKIFERRWALTLLERTLQRLQAEQGAPERRERFEILRGYLLRDPSGETYAAVGRRLGVSEGAMKAAVSRMRQRYRELFQEEIASTVGSEEEVEAEMRHVFTVLNR